MTKKEMIARIVFDAIKRSEAHARKVARFGKDSQEAKEALNEWAQSTSLLTNLGLLDEYLKKCEEWGIA